MQALDVSLKPLMSREKAIENIYELEAAIQALPNSFDKDSPMFSYRHWFVPGIYGREITIPAGVVLTTEIHASENIAIVSKGSFTFYSERGLEYVEAPAAMITKIGTKRAMYTHTEVIFTTFHQNLDNERDIDTLVARYTFEDEKVFQQYKQDLLEVIS